MPLERRGGARILAACQSHPLRFCSLVVIRELLPAAMSDLIRRAEATANKEVQPSERPPPRVPYDEPATSTKGAPLCGGQKASPPSRGCTPLSATGHANALSGIQLPRFRD
jgi:hypothetical protein